MKLVKELSAVAQSVFDGDYFTGEAITDDGRFVIVSWEAKFDSWEAGTHDGIRDGAGSVKTCEAGFRKYRLTPAVRAVLEENGYQPKSEPALSAALEKALKANEIHVRNDGRAWFFDSLGRTVVLNHRDSKILADMGLNNPD